VDIPPRTDRLPQRKARTVSPPAVGERASTDRVLASRPAILVVDDEPGITSLLAELVSQENCAVDRAADGEEALERLRQRPYTLVLCDIRMPRMNGIAFYQAIEQWQPQLLWRLLFITGDILSPDTREFLEQTDAPVLEKPFRIEDIRAIIRQFL
jgi:CheY-like chemotaxis protein